MLSETCFYVYIIFDWNGIPRYVGKGSGDRIDRHHQGIDRYNKQKNHFIRITMSKLGDVPRIKIACDLTEEEALRLEIFIIAAIGRKPDGPLVNVQAGGNQPPKERASFEERSRRVKKWMAALTPEERRERARHLIAGRTPEQWSEIGRRGAAGLTTEQRRSHARSQQAKLSPAERQESMRVARAAQTDEHKRQRGLTNYANQSPKRRAEMLANLKTVSAIAWKKRSKPVTIGGISYPSLTAAAKDLGCSISVIHKIVDRGGRFDLRCGPRPTARRNRARDAKGRYSS